MPEQKNPPEKLSDLIDLAVGDARNLDPETYMPNCWAWHEPQPALGRRCLICVAGAVIAGTLGIDRGTEVVLGKSETGKVDCDEIADDAWRRALMALEHAREGKWKDAIETRGQQADTEQTDEMNAIPPPTSKQFNDWKSFDAHIGSLADRAARLRGIGL